jgi:hypothetical protein
MLARGLRIVIGRRRRESHVYLDFEEEWIAAQTMADRNKDWQER